MKKKKAELPHIVAKLYYGTRFLFKEIPKKDYLSPAKIRLMLTVRPYTMVTYPRLAKLYEIGLHLEKEGISGSFVECGTCNGGTAGVIASTSKNNKARDIWLFDSWEGLPEPTKYDVSFKGVMGNKGRDLGSEEKVKELIFKKLKLDKNRIRLVKGWFEKTIPPHRKDMGEIALLHLDCDWYESVSLCLEQLYDKVVKGGFIIIDDYGYWKGCKKAVDEFIKRRDLKVEPQKVSKEAVFWQKD